MYLFIFPFPSRQIPLASSDFDSRQKILNSLRAVFPNGTLSLGESASNKIVAKYFTHLKQKYVNSVSEDESLKRICYQTDSLGRQSHSYWLLSPEVCIMNSLIPASLSLRATCESNSTCKSSWLCRRRYCLEWPTTCCLKSQDRSKSMSWKERNKRSCREKKATKLTKNEVCFNNLKMSRSRCDLLLRVKKLSNSFILF